MSFSSNVKEELEKIMPTGRHCQLAELLAIYKLSNKEIDEKSNQIVITSENELTIRKYFTLLKKTFNMYKGYSWETVCQKKGQVYRLLCDDAEIISQLNGGLDAGVVTERLCCKRAYIRGAFMATGSISDPEKSYHLEFVCTSEEEALFIKDLLSAFEVEAKIIIRKKYFVLYVKEGTQIVDILNVCGAHIAMMEFENIRILKDVRNSVNRKMNCEIANIGKTVSASTKQVEDIKILMSNESAYKNLSQNLKEMAQLRLSFPEATLKELGEMSDPPIGKSGVNHRLRKLSELAEIVKEENYD